MNKVSVKTKKKDDFNHKKYLFSAVSLIVGLGLSYTVIFHLCDGNVLQRQIADLSKIINLMDVIWYFCLAILAILSFVFSFILFRKKDLPKITLASFVIIANLEFSRFFYPNLYCKNFYCWRYYDGGTHQADL